MEDKLVIQFFFKKRLCCEAVFKNVNNAKKAIEICNRVSEYIVLEKNIQATERCIIAALNTDGGALLRTMYDGGPCLNYDDCYLAEMSTIDGDWKIHYGDTVISA